MADRFAVHAPDLDSPAAYAAAVTPNSSADLPTASRALWVGTAGDLHITTVSGDSVTLKAVSGWVPVRCARVHQDSTAADIVAFW